MKPVFKLLLRLSAIGFITVSLFAITSIYSVFDYLYKDDGSYELNIGWPYRYYQSFYMGASENDTGWRHGSEPINLFADVFLFFIVAVMIYVGYSYLLKKLAARP